MGIRQGGKATIWKFRKGRGDYYNVELSVRRRRKDTGEFVTDFSGPVRFIGKAAEDLEHCGRYTKIIINECDVTNFTTIDGERRYIVKVYDFDVVSY